MSVRRTLACNEIYNRIKTNRVAIGLKSFKKVATTQAKIEEAPICFMSYGEDAIIKRSSRSISPFGCTRSLEIFLEFVCHEDVNIEEICAKIRTYVLSDPNPIYSLTGVVDKTTYMMEDRTEGPKGYGLPEVQAMILVIILVYVDEP
jgi:hypothetical protein